MLTNIIRHTSLFVTRQLALITVGTGVLAYFWPQPFLPIGGFFQFLFAITMFALGAVLDWQELKITLQQPGKISLGVLTQFIVMPMLAWLIASVAGFPPAITLGFIIVGCAPGAMASNVIVYLAGGVLAFSLAMTTFATLLSPLLTPALVKWLASAQLDIAFWPLVWTISKIVLIPILLGMLARRFMHAQARIHIETLAPALAAFSIVLICSYAIAKNQAMLADVALGILAAVIAVNLCGYLAGWWLGKLYRFDLAERKTLSIEIGMQNAGMGVALALAHFEPAAALPGALFATWSVLSASLLSQVMHYRMKK